MKAASIAEIKQELITLPSKKVLELCLRLAKYKKENKELLSYLLFNAHDEHAFVENVKNEIDEQFTELPKANVYLTKKSLRKILKGIGKYSRHTGTGESAIEMLIHFCTKVKTSGIPLYRNQALSNLYNQQLKKINKLMESIHEDLHFDYKKKLEQLI
jgi:phosphoenolpyruvate carboxylase